MHAYFDSSALVKRGLSETESKALEDTVQHMIQNGEQLSSSTLAWVEVARAIRSRIDDDEPMMIADLTESALSGISESPLSDQVIGLARRVGPPRLRSLDAIHLATATLLDADVVIAYDERLLVAAREMGFRTASPGAD